MTKEEISLYANKYRKTQKGVLIFIGIILNLQLSSGRTDIVTMLGCPIYKYDVSLKLFGSLFISFNGVSKIPP